MKLSLLLAFTLVALGVLSIPRTEAAVPPVAQCDAPNARLSIDHVIIAVTDLDAASRTYRQLGFTLKEGRLHDNGLNNRHMKLRDGTELELMSVVGEPGDDMAVAYARFLRSGEGGAYLAMRAVQTDILSAAEGVGISAEPLHVGGFSYVTFSSPGTEDVFFVVHDIQAEDADSLLVHKNGSEGFSLVWLEASPQFERLLLAMGAVACGRMTLPDGRVGNKHGVGGGAVVVTSPSGMRARVIGVVLRSAQSSEGELHAPEEAHGVWLGFTNPSLVRDRM